MPKIPDSFSGYLNINGDEFAYFFSDSIVTMLPTKDDADGAFERVVSMNDDEPNFIFGTYCGHKVAFYRKNRLSYGVLRIDKSIRFFPSVIIMASGNTAAFDDKLTDDWDKFHAITFCGGNINSVFAPDAAIKREKEVTKHDGSGSVEFAPWDSYTLESSCKLAGEKIHITVSVGRSDKSHEKDLTDGYNPATLNSFVQLIFENPQSLDKIEKYYLIVKRLISLLNIADNVCFDAYLSQRQPDGKLYRTALCRIPDHYENYSDRKINRVVKLNEVADYLPKLLELIEKGEADNLIYLLPDDNKSKDKMSLTNIQDMCSALEIAYNRKSEYRKNTGLLNELKKVIAKAVDEFKENHPDFNPNTQTTVSSAFKYLDMTLKEKIMALYRENEEIIDFIAKKNGLPTLSERAIKDFVDVRNSKTHSGKFEWKSTTESYLQLLALTYAAFFKDLGMPEGQVKGIIRRIF